MCSHGCRQLVENKHVASWSKLIVKPIIHGLAASWFKMFQEVCKWQIATSLIIIDLHVATWCNWQATDFMLWLNLNICVASYKIHCTQLKMPQTCCKWSILPVCCNLSTSCNKLVSFMKFNKSVKIRLDLICHFQTWYKLLKQLAARVWITCFDNQLSTCLQIELTCQQQVVWPQAMQKHHWWIIEVSYRMSTDLLQFSCFLAA